MVSAAILLAAGALACALAFFQLGARRLYGYTITPTCLEVRLFGRLPVLRIARHTIAGAALWRPSLADVAAAFTTLRIGNRIFGPAVVIDLRGRKVRKIILTPDDPHRFIAELQARCRPSDDLSR